MRKIFAAVEAEDLGLDLRRQLRIAVHLLELRCDLEHTEGLDLRLRAAVEDAVGAPHHVVVAEVLEQFADQDAARRSRRSSRCSTRCRARRTRSCCCSAVMPALRSAAINWSEPCASSGRSMRLVERCVSTLARPSRLPPCRADARVVDDEVTPRDTSSRRSPISTGWLCSTSKPGIGRPLWIAKFGMPSDEAVLDELVPDVVVQEVALAADARRPPGPHAGYAFQLTAFHVRILTPPSSSRRPGAPSDRWASPGSG